MASRERGELGLFNAGRENEARPGGGAVPEQEATWGRGARDSPPFHALSSCNTVYGVLRALHFARCIRSTRLHVPVLEWGFHGVRCRTRTAHTDSEQAFLLRFGPPPIPWMATRQPATAAQRAIPGRSCRPMHTHVPRGWWAVTLAACMCHDHGTRRATSQPACLTTQLPFFPRQIRSSGPLHKPTS